MPCARVKALGRNEMRKTLAEGAVADLIMVLQEGDEGCWGQMARGLAA